MDKSYFNEDRYGSTDLTENDIKLEVNKRSPIYTHYEHDYMEKAESIKILEDFVVADEEMKEIIDNIPVYESKKKVNLSIETTNKIYSFCIEKLSNDYTEVEIFDIITTYLKVDGKDIYEKLSIKFRERLLKELEESGHYKSKALF